MLTRDLSESQFESISRLPSNLKRPHFTAEYQSFKFPRTPQNNSTDSISSSYFHPSSSATSLSSLKDHYEITDNESCISDDYEEECDCENSCGCSVLSLDSLDLEKRDSSNSNSSTNIIPPIHHHRPNKILKPMTQVSHLNVSIGSNLPPVPSLSSQQPPPPSFLRERPRPPPLEHLKTNHSLSSCSSSSSASSARPTLSPPSSSHMLLEDHEEDLCGDLPTPTAGRTIIPSLDQPVGLEAEILRRNKLLQLQEIESVMQPYDHHDENASNNSISKHDPSVSSQNSSKWWNSRIDPLNLRDNIIINNNHHNHRFNQLPLKAHMMMRTEEEYEPGAAAEKDAKEKAEKEKEEIKEAKEEELFVQQINQKNVPNHAQKKVFKPLLKPISFLSPENNSSTSSSSTASFSSSSFSSFPFKPKPFSSTYSPSSSSSSSSSLSTNLMNALPSLIDHHDINKNRPTNPVAFTLDGDDENNENNNTLTRISHENDEDQGEYNGRNNMNHRIHHLDDDDEDSMSNPFKLFKCQDNNKDNENNHEDDDDDDEELNGYHSPSTHMPFSDPTGTTGPLGGGGAAGNQIQQQQSHPTTQSFFRFGNGYQNTNS